jgi:membrane protein
MATIWDWFSFSIFDLTSIVLLFAMLFRYSPDAKIAWHDVWTGAALTAILFVIGKFLLGLYLSSGAAGSAYGAASSLVTLLLWGFLFCPNSTFRRRIHQNLC